MKSASYIYICIGVYIAIKLVQCTGMQVIYTRKTVGVGLSASYPYLHCTRSRKKSDLMYWYARHLCWIDWGVYLPSADCGVYMCIILFIYRSVIPLHVAAKFICFTIGLFIHTHTHTHIYIYIYIYIYICHYTASSSKPDVLHWSHSLILGGPL